jgi:hypothetical protein
MENKIKQLTKEKIQLYINELMKVIFSRQTFINKEDEDLLRELNKELINRI